MGSFTNIEYLSSQFRVRGGNAYVQYLDKLVKCNLEPGAEIYRSKDYEFMLFDSLADMLNEIKLRNTEHGLSRLIAGYSWKWVSKNNKNAFDIHIGDIELKWNSVPLDWVNSANSINEVGCIHTTQGYDLNYAGIIFGNEISYDREKDEIVILKENYFDKYGKNSVTDPEQLKHFIINIYKTIMLRGIKGTYVYVCDPALRAYLASHMAIYGKEHSIKRIVRAGLVPYQNSIPLYDLDAAAGAFSDLQEVNDFEWVELPSRYKATDDLFACRVVGESMNRVIPNGAVCLFRKYSGGSRSGKIVLVESTELQCSLFGSRYTVKEYQSRKVVEEEGWSHQSVTLKPLSDDPEFKAIEVADDELASIKVIGIFECVLA